MSPILLTLLAADSSIGLVRSIDKDSIQTLSGKSASYFGCGEWRTYIVRLVKDDDTLFGQLSRDILCDFRVEQIVKGENDDVEVWHLSEDQQGVQSRMERKMLTIRRIVKYGQTPFS